jgi:hypothetical protein
MDATRYTELVARWDHNKNLISAQKKGVDETKNIRDEIKTCKELLTEAMLNQQITNFQTPQGWVCLKKTRSKPQRTDEFIKTVFCEFHKQHSTEESLSLNHVGDKFVTFVCVCQEKIATEKYTVTLQKSAPMSVSISNCIITNN